MAVCCRMKDKRNIILTVEGKETQGHILNDTNTWTKHVSNKEFLKRIRTRRKFILTIRKIQLKFLICLMRK